jgi:hypothetical protein
MITLDFFNMRADMLDQSTSTDRQTDPTTTRLFLGWVLPTLNTLVPLRH